MHEYVFGANIIENLTTGMYQDSKVIYREYIQNSCDQIDKAISEGFLRKGEGKIEIWLDLSQRTISIEDNATGIPASEFERTLSNIADSDKQIGKDKGFRGIGRLCGLAYCKELVFTSTVKGEDTISIMRCNAEKMRQLFDENSRGKKHTASDVLQAINKFESNKTKDINAHFFKVELIGINKENEDLLDTLKIKEYLSFVAPAPYQNTFHYREKIKKHAKEIAYHIDEYSITLDGQPIFKKYYTILKKADNNKLDDIFDVVFEDFRDEDGSLFAWMWVGLTQFKQAIPKINQMRGLRLRKNNIQIGGEDALQKLFKEDRGNSYFVGEVFAVAKDLIPNSQRDYFNENPTRAYFEKVLRRFFNEELQKTYYNGSTVNSAYKKIDAYKAKEAEFAEKEIKGSFVSEEHRAIEFEIVQVAKKQAADAQSKIVKTKQKAHGIFAKVIERIEKEHPQDPVSTVPSTTPPTPARQVRRTDKLSAYNKKERKLISKIFDIIVSTTDSKTAEMIISKIEDGLS
ncbi:molecular chaperone of HSP90 family [Desulfosporosinus orientis DSM 765]|uniref:Molecular chaperone of HSP90 family n=1 Tax=Desulfosporosinus orientis (strain ATCC 19365 / DSM 765 / NCIMB 8382 / VKM B-1628 / Singapore I) TaxID=768706 RepID=G7WFB2_DESOD|nr:ATP-binding protein [Desulfosporosinus orientis]AET67998.1 molecular chaperone of HSP90 family [Desulfosporosinus orientis DSM 765]